MKKNLPLLCLVMAIHRFKCSESLNKEIMEFSEIHKFDTKENLIQQFDSWLINKKEIIDKESQFLESNEYETDINVKIFKSIKYYYIKKYLKPEKDKEKDKKKKLPTLIIPSIKNIIKGDIEENFRVNRNFKPSDSYNMLVKKDGIEDNAANKKCYKNHYYQIKNKKYYVNEE